MAVYYNEFDPYAAEWLRNLIAAGDIAYGHVDERDIREVQPDDLRGFTQHHFFAGIGGWSVALRNAGWPDDRPVWTGSCPCQDYSSAGKKARQSGERHLWPDWFRLIRQCRPDIIYGEQVASAVGAGWLDDVAHGLEAEEYAIAAAVLPACAAGGFHRRDRLWFVANAITGQLQEAGRQPQQRTGQRNDDKGSPMAYPAGGDAGRSPGTVQGTHEQQAGERPQGRAAESGRAGALGDPAGTRPPHGGIGTLGAPGTQQEPERPGGGDVGNAEHNGQHGHAQPGSHGKNVSDPAEGSKFAIEPSGTGEPVNVADTGSARQQEPRELQQPLHSEAGGIGQTDRPFDDSAGIGWIECPDGKIRAVKPGIRLLADGVSGRVAVRRATGQGEAAVQEHWYNRTGALTGFGNAIHPPTATQFIIATEGWKQ